MKNSEIDLIIPIYSNHNNLDKLLISILKQTIVDFISIIIINDNSRENFKKVIDKYQSKLKITYIKNNKNMGPGYSRNVGINASKAKYIIFCDEDDEFYNEKSVENLYNRIEKDNKVNVVSGYIFNNHKRYRDMQAVWGRIYKREFIEKYNIRFLNSYYHEEIPFMMDIKLYSMPKQLIYIKNYVYKYNKGIDKKSLTSNIVSYSKNIDSVLLGYKKALKKAKKFGLDKEALKYSTNTLDILCNNFYQNLKFFSENETILYLKKCYKFYNKYQKYININFQNELNIEKNNAFISLLQKFQK